MRVETSEISVSGHESWRIQTKVEGQDLQQLAYGTASAKKVVVSFWVKSSVTGVYAFAIYRDYQNRVIGDTFTINSPNRWEQKTIMIAPDTAALLNDDNRIGFTLNWYLSASPSESNGNNQHWSSLPSSSMAFGHAVNVGGTHDATFEITGVQLDVGEQAASFRYEFYGETLMKCQRYFWQTGTGNNYSFVGCGYVATSSVVNIFMDYPDMRSKPSLSSSGVFHILTAGGGDSDVSGFLLKDPTNKEARLDCAVTGLTKYMPAFLRNKNDANAVLKLDAEL